jgi:UDP-glucose 4-epimerase
MRVIVTGGSGFIGSKIVQKICGQDHEVIVFDINTKDGIRDGVEYIKGDIFDSKHVQEVINGSECVIHMVGLPNARKAQERPQFSYDLNIRSVQSILETMRESEINTFILPSSAVVYGKTEIEGGIPENTEPNLVNTYAYHKWIAEGICRCYSINYGIKSTIIRPFNVYGGEGTGIINILVEKAKKNDTIELYGEEQLRDFIHIDDVATAFLKVLDCDSCINQTINVGTGVGRSIKDIVELVKEYFPNLKSEKKEFKGELYNSIADISRLKELTGFEPNSSIKVLKDTIEEMI